jgi:hypothetical protein
MPLLLAQAAEAEQLQIQLSELLAKTGQRLLLLVLVFLLALQAEEVVVVMAVLLELRVGLEDPAEDLATVFLLLETPLLVKDLLEDMTLHVIHRIMDLVVV